MYVKCTNNDTFPEILTVGKVYKVHFQDNKYYAVTADMPVFTMYKNLPPNTGMFSKSRFINVTCRNTKLGKILYR